VFAVGLTLLLFVLWSAVGYAVLLWLGEPRSRPWQMLLAPAVGLAVMVLLAYGLSSAGIPVGRFGPLMVAVTAVAAVASFWRFSWAVPVRRFLPVAALLLLAFLLVGHPLVRYGFDWLSYANDDMANYVLAAHRLVDHGLFDAPRITDLLGGRDTTSWYWSLAIAGVRPGSELVLALVISLTGLTGAQVFMPVIVSIHLALLSAAAATLRRRDISGEALGMLALLAVSALTTLGTLYQLIAQLLGLTLLAAAASVALRYWPDGGARDAIRRGLLTGLLTAALAVAYPEVLPFFVLAFVIGTAIALARRRLAVGQWSIFLVASLGSTVVIGNRYLLFALDLLRQRVASGFAPADVSRSLFPYYLVPSGLADLWGLQKIGSLPGEPWLSLSIVIGGLLLAGAIVAVVRQTWELQPAGLVAFVMLGLAIRLFVFRNDFGLFKLAMYGQPFVLAAVVATWLSSASGWPRLARLAPLLLLGLVGLPTQTSYVMSSVGSQAGMGPLTEIPGATQSRVLAEFGALVDEARPRQLLLDTGNVVLAKLQTVYTRGIETALPSRTFFNLARLDMTRLREPKALAAAGPVAEAGAAIYRKAAFALHDRRRPGAANGFVPIRMADPGKGSADETTLIAVTGRQSVVNRRGLADEREKDFVARPYSQFHDHLIFIHSDLGQSYFLPDDPDRVSLYQLERDPLVAGATMAGIGRYALFEVVGPSPAVRFEVSLTATLKGDGCNRLPTSAVAIGASRVTLPFVGRGSARIFSPPLAPQRIAGRSYVAIDLGSDGQLLPDRRTSLMRSYGTDVSLDRRRLTAFARDISLVAAEAYGRLAPPSRLARFPDDLANGDLEYSGLYEDGWVGEAAFLRLAQPRNEAALVVRGTVPRIRDRDFSTEVRVLVDEREVAHRLLAPGEFEIRATPGAGRAVRRIDLRFTRVQSLPAPDGRPVAALLKGIGFAPPAPDVPPATAANAAEPIAPGRAARSAGAAEGLRP
jgi:hypothetical protein